MDCTLSIFVVANNRVTEKANKSFVNIASLSFDFFMGTYKKNERL